MGLIDTHCHLYLEDFDPEQEQLIEAAKASGIERLLMPNVGCMRFATAMPTLRFR